MKKCFIIAIAALAAVSACTKVDPVNTVTKDTAISFSVINHLHQTRATEGLTYPTTVPFGTFAWWTACEWDQETAPQEFVFMNNEEIKYKQLEASGPYVWAPASAYYWTKSGKLTFASYSPYVKEINDETKAAKGFSAIPAHDPALGFQFVDYTIVDNTNVDLMYANLAKDCTQDTNTDGTAVTDSSNPEGGFKGVPTIFNHALCQVAFAFRAIGNKNPNVEDIKIIIKEVKIANIDKKGTFTQNPATNGAARWASTHATGNYTNYSYLTPEGNPQTNAVELSFIDLGVTPTAVSATDNYTGIGDARILLPQTLAVTTDTNNAPVDPTPNTVTDQKLIVDYTIKTKYASSTEWATEEVTSVARLKTSNMVAWADNQNILYRISIYPNAAVPVTFDPAVVSWTDVYSNIDIIAHND